MPPVADYYDDVRDEPKPITEEYDSVADDPTVDPERLAKLLEQPTDTARHVLRLMDGVESYHPPLFEDIEDGLLLPGFEGFKDTLHDLWERIKQWLAAVRRWIMDDGRQADIALNALSLQCENLKVDTRAKLSSQQSGQFKIKGRITSLSVFYAPPRDIGQLISNLRMMNRFMGDYLNLVDRQMLGNVGRVAVRVSQLDPARLFAPDLEDLAVELRRMAPENAITSLNLQPVKGSSRRYSSLHLMGNLRLIYQPGGDARGMSRVLSQTLRLMHSDINPRPMPPEITFSKFGRIQSDQLLQWVGTSIDQLKHHTQPAMRKRRMRSLEEMEMAVDRFIQKTDQLTDTDTQGHRELIRQVVQTGRSVNDWLNNPYHGMIANHIRSLRAALMVCRMNVS